MKTSEQIDKLLPALAKVKANLSTVKKSSNNPFFKSKYADLNAHLDVVEPLLESNGLLLVQPTSTVAEGNGNIVSSRIYHTESGQFIEASMKLIGENDMQKAGSAVTYARRYTLGALLSMQAVDDDGNDASSKTTKQSTQSETKTEVKVETAPKDKPSFRNYKKKVEVPKVEKTSSEDDI